MRAWMFLFFFVFFLFSTYGEGSTHFIGRIIELEGKAIFKDRFGKPRVVFKGAVLKYGDVLYSDKESRVKIWLADESVWHLGPNSVVQFHHLNFHNSRKRERELEVSILRGAVRFLEAIPNQLSAGIKIKTPVVTMNLIPPVEGQIEVFKKEELRVKAGVISGLMRTDNFEVKARQVFIGEKSEDQIFSNVERMETSLYSFLSQDFSNLFYQKEEPQRNFSFPVKLVFLEKIFKNMNSKQSLRKPASIGFEIPKVKAIRIHETVYDVVVIAAEREARKWAKKIAFQMVFPLARRAAYHIAMRAAAIKGRQAAQIVVDREVEDAVGEAINGLKMKGKRLEEEQIYQYSASEVAGASVKRVAKIRAEVAGYQAARKTAFKAAWAAAYAGAYEAAQRKAYRMAYKSAKVAAWDVMKKNSLVNNVEVEALLKIISNKASHYFANQWAKKAGKIAALRESRRVALIAASQTSAIIAEQLSQTSKVRARKLTAELLAKKKARSIASNLLYYVREEAQKRFEVELHERSLKASRALRP